MGVLQTPALTTWPRRRGAEDGIRTRDLLLGKEMCYHCTTSAYLLVRVRGLEPPRELAPNSPSSWRVYLIPPHPHGVVPVLTGKQILPETAAVVNPLTRALAGDRPADSTVFSWRLWAVRIIIAQRLDWCKASTRSGTCVCERIDTPSFGSYN